MVQMGLRGCSRLKRFEKPIVRVAGRGKSQLTRQREDKLVAGSQAKGKIALVDFELHSRDIDRSFSPRCYLRSLVTLL